MRVGIVGGTGFYDLLPAAELVRLETPYGQVQVSASTHGGRSIFFANRHGAGHALPPHAQDPRAVVDAMARCRVDVLLSLLNVGSLRPGIAAGDLVVPNDLVDPFPHPHRTFFDAEAVHVDLSPPYCKAVGAALVAAARPAGKAKGRVHVEAVYVNVRGPRLETVAEVAWLATLGHVVGMTGGAEASLARERGLCHAALAFVANAAAGDLAATRIRDALADRAADLGRILLDAAARVPEARGCRCADAPGRGRLATPEKR